jgi:hypothetical protein
MIDGIASFSLPLLQNAANKAKRMPFVELRLYHDDVVKNGQT